MAINGALLQYFSELFCDGLGLANYLQPNQDGLLNFTNRIGLSLISPAAGISDLGGQAAQFLTDTQRTVGAAICDQDPLNFSPVLPSPAFSGGQCFARYSVVISASYRSGSAQNLLNVSPGPYTQPLGPIEGIEWFRTPANRLQLRLICRGTTTNPTAGFFVILDTGGIVNPETASIVSLSLFSGAPDNCGNPPVAIPPGVKDPFSIVGPDLDVDGGDGNGGYTIPNPTINFGPVSVNLDNGLSVDVELPDAGLCGTFILTPEPRFDLKPCSSPPLPRSKQPLPESGDPDVEPPEELDDDDEEEDDTSDPIKTIIGVFVQSEPDGPYTQTEIDAGESGALLVPRIGTINFKCVIEDDSGVEIERGWTPPVDLKQVRAYVPAPSDVKVVAYNVLSSPGWKHKARAFEEDYPLCPCSESDRIADVN